MRVPPGGPQRPRPRPDANSPKSEGLGNDKKGNHLEAREPSTSTPVPFALKLEPPEHPKNIREPVAPGVAFVGDLRHLIHRPGLCVVEWRHPFPAADSWVNCSKKKRFFASVQKFDSIIKRVASRSSDGIAPHSQKRRARQKYTPANRCRWSLYTCQL